MSCLADAFEPTVPGPMLPPGPRHNTWPGSTVTAADSAEVGLLRALWGPVGRHRAADGTRTTIACRPVPSAGAAYPVQSHLVVPRGHSGALAPGRYVLVDGMVHRRPGSAPDLPGGVRLAFTVLPGRTFARYHHRAWPLWLADVAYAVEAARWLIGHEGLPITVGCSRVRALLGTAPAQDQQWWFDRGLLPEVAVAAVELPQAIILDQDRAACLRRRRSPSHADFSETTPSELYVDGTAVTDPTTRARHLDEAVAQSGQEWVRGARRLSLWTVGTGQVDRRGLVHLWERHRSAAAEFHRRLGLGDRIRPVSGFVRTRPGGPVPWLHGLAYAPEESP